MYWYKMPFVYCVCVAMMYVRLWMGYNRDMTQSIGYSLYKILTEINCDKDIDW